MSWSNIFVVFKLIWSVITNKRECTMEKTNSQDVKINVIGNVAGDLTINRDINQSQDNSKKKTDDAMKSQCESGKADAISVKGKTEERFGDF